METQIKKIENETIAFVSALIIGFIAHGFIFMNNITLHDNIYNFYMGGTYTSGRWMLGKLLRLSQIVYDTNYLHFSTPWYLGFISLLFLGLSASVFVFILQIKGKVSSALIGGIMVSFPAVASMFGYMFTAGMYALGIFIGVLGAACICMATRYKGLVGIFLVLAGIVLQASSVGVYQANMSFMLSVTLLYFIHTLLKEELNGVGKVFKRILFYGLETIGYLGTYYVASKYFLKKVGDSISSYRGMDGMGSTKLIEYVERIGTAYKEFVNPTAMESKYMYMGGVRPLYNWILILLVGMIVLLLWTKFLHKWFERILCLLAILVMPISLNLVYLMVSDGIYSLMVYGEVMIFIMAIYFCENVDVKKAVFIKTATILPILMAIVLYARFANVCYLKADYVQKASISYFDRMIARIESVEGYVDGMPVAFIGERPAVTETLYLYPEFSEVYIWPYEFDTMVNNYNWYPFMKSQCGFNAPWQDSCVFEDRKEVLAMPSYPSSGSVKVLDGCVVVKFE